MKNLLATLATVALGTTAIVPLQVNSLAISSKQESYQLIDLPQQKSDIFAFGTFQQELYLGMADGYFAKMDGKGQITNLPRQSGPGEEPGDVDFKIISSLKEYQGELYFVAGTQLAKVTATGDIKVLYQFPFYSELGKLEIFNNELYFSYFSIEDYSSLMKITNNGRIVKVFNYQAGDVPTAIKSFNNHLYIATALGTLSKLAENGEVTKIANEGLDIMNFVAFKQELYLSSMSGTIFKLDPADQITKVIDRDLFFGNSALVVYHDELLLANDKKLEKLTSDNSIVTMLTAKDAIEALAVFNDELYLGMDQGYFAKLS